MNPLAEFIWNAKYRHAAGGPGADSSLDATFRRVAAAIAAPEKDSGRWESAFYSLLSGMRFLPGGRILASAGTGAGTGRHATLFNCFVAGSLQDSMEGILNALKEAAVTMQSGGGIGCDFSVLRPAGTPAVQAGTTASGPVSFLRIWNSLCDTVQSTSSRRGAMMATLRCDHPDIEGFIAAKREPGVLSNFNLSVLITDAFMQAVSADAEWPLVFPAPEARESQHDSCRNWRRLSARVLWSQIVMQAHATGEPGMLFVDRINQENNLWYCETISATNPCGEVPLPPFGACDLGSINLARMVSKPFTADGAIEEQLLLDTVSLAVRFLDNVIDVSHFPLSRQARQAQSTRRIGLGITGLADMLAMLGLLYDSDDGRACAARILELVRDQAYLESTRLALEKGPFPRFDASRYLDGRFIRRLPDPIRDNIAAHGIRNSHLLAVAPAGTISLLAGNLSSGIEPIFALEARRTIRGSDLQLHDIEVRDYAWSQWLEGGGDASHSPGFFVTAENLPPPAHLAMQACLQPFVDAAISKTINLPTAATLEDVNDVFRSAYAQGIKGCTVFRSGSARGQVLRATSCRNTS